MIKRFFCWAKKHTIDIFRISLTLSKFPKLNPSQRSFILNLCENKPYGGSLFCDEGLYSGDGWSVKISNKALTLCTSYPEFKSLADKGMLLMGDEGWHSIEGIRKKSFEFSIDGLAYDFYIYNRSLWLKKAFIYLLFIIIIIPKTIVELLLKAIAH
jgi:hypothetical protein